MKPVLEYLPRSAEESFVVKFFDYDFYPTPWHYHPEFELVLVTESTGKRFIGDDVSDFAPGNLAFIGPDLPHLYRNDDAYYKQKSNVRAKSIVVHFLEDSFGKDFLLLPEAAPLRQLFFRSSQGMDIQGNTNVVVSKMLHELVMLKGLERWRKLVDILYVISMTEEYSIISNHAIKGRHERDSDRLNSVMEWVMKSFQKEITLKEMALLVGMTEPSFSRYFRQRTRKTFSSFVSEIRLGHAAKLLQDDNMNVASICFESGFNNLSNFNRMFKRHYGVSPGSFRQKYQSAIAVL